MAKTTSWAANFKTADVAIGWAGGLAAQSDIISTDVKSSLKRTPLGPHALQAWCEVPTLAHVCECGPGPACEQVGEIP